MENQFSTQGIINLEKDLSLRKKAEKYIPGGMWGHMSVKKLPYGYPLMIAMCLIPMLWRKVMNPRVENWKKRFYPETL